jgi:tetratricopeptide (TPR) repeat protein
MTDVLTAGADAAALLEERASLERRKPAWADWRDFAKKCEASGQIDLAIDAWERLTVLDPGVRPLRKHLVALLLQAGREADALPHQFMLASAETEPKAWAQFARRAEALRRPDIAIEAWRAVARGHPASVEAWSRLWALQLEGAAADEAPDIADEQREPAAWYGLGGVLDELGRLPDSILAYRRVLDLGGEAADLRLVMLAHLALADLLQRIGEADEALPHLRWLAASLGHGQDKLRRRIARVLDTLGDPETALATWRAIADAVPDDAEALDRVGELLLQQSRPDEAAPWLEASLRLNPAWGKKWARLGRALQARGDAAGAIEALVKAVTLAPELETAHLLLAELLFEAGRTSEALEAVKGSPAAAQALAEAGYEVGSGEDWLATSVARRCCEAGRRRDAEKLVTRCIHPARLLQAVMALPDPPRRKAPAKGGQPLVLISQVQRSGGTLLAQLFDGHPQLLAYPHELKIGRPRKWNWPALDFSAAPADWMASLFDPSLAEFMASGYVKADGNPHAQQAALPFDLSLEAFCADFMAAAEGSGRQRQVLDAYFAAFFSAWENARPTGRETWVTAFCPRLSMVQRSVEGLFTDYPDGRLICCIREPVAWYASSSRHAPEYADPRAAADLWNASTRSALALAASRPDQVFLLSYEALVQDPAWVMSRLAGWLAIEACDVLLTPTFAGEAVLPNSSYPVAETGIHRRSLRAAPGLAFPEVSAIERRTFDWYCRAVERLEAGGGVWHSGDGAA